jgi:membrane protease subunit HflC
MKNIALLIFVVILVIVLGLYLVSFQVRETESALVMTFGNPTREITTPGLHYKWPTPIQRVYTFDSRMRVFEADLIETETAEQIPIIVNTFIVWKIAEPLKFFKAIGTVREAENDKLLPLISDTQNTVIGRHQLGEFVNSDPDKIKFPKIEEEMLIDLQQEVADANYGIEIKTLGIKQLKFSTDVSTQVFERMRAERKRRTDLTIAEGNAEATRIKTDANSIKRELLAAAEARAKGIRAEGDLLAAQHYRLLEADTDLAMFLADIEALKEILAERSTIVLTTDTDLVRILQKMPDIKPSEPNEPK